MAGTYHVSATSVADVSKSAVATVTVTAPAAVSISIDPTSVSLHPGGTQQFTATVSNAADTSATWSVSEGTAGGSVSSAGLYTAPAIAGAYHVVATSRADATKTATAAITVTPAASTVSISIDPTSANVAPGATRQFTATVTGSSNISVNWTVSESGGGSVSTTGLYTAPATAGTYHVLATSAADTSRSATATVTVGCPACTITVTSGDAQIAMIEQALAAPVILTVKNGGSPAAGVPITVTAPEGIALNPASGVSDGTGRFATNITLGRIAGPVNFSASTGGTGVSFSASATAPTAGTVVPIVNAAHASGTGAPGPSTVVNEDGITGIAVKSDGTIYYTDFMYVRSVSPAGAVANVAGNGTSIGIGGEGVSATSTPLVQPCCLALDEAHHVLYVSEVGNNRVRRIDLIAGTISTYAGGGSAGGPGFGDGGLASSAVFDYPGALSVAADGTLYVSDRGLSSSFGHARIRRIDPDGLIHAYMGAPNCTTGNIGSLIGFGIPLSDAPGTVFAMGYVCDGVDNVGTGTSSSGIVRIDSAVTRVAGGAALADNNGSEAIESDLGPWAEMTADQAGDLFVVNSDHRVRRIDATSGQITTIAGTRTQGSSGDFGPATGATFDFTGDTGIAVDAAQNVYVVDSGNRSIRMIAKAGSATRSSVMLTAHGATTQSVYRDQTFTTPLGVTLAGTGPLVGFDVNWEAINAASAVDSPTTKTGASGIALQLGRPGYATGTYTFKAYFLDIRGNVVAGPVSFSVTAVDPPAGTFFRLTNAHSVWQQGSVSTTPFSGPAIEAHPELGIEQLAPDTSGGFFFHDPSNDFVYHVGTDGMLTWVAGAGGGGDQNSGDGQAPKTATFPSTGGYAYHAASNTLYTTAFPNSAGPSLVRAIDFTNQVVNTIAGGGSSHDDGVPATTADISTMTPWSIAVTSDKSVWLAGNPGSGETAILRKIDGSTGKISTVVGPCSTSISTSQPLFPAEYTKAVWADASNNIYFFAQYGDCSDILHTEYEALLKRTPAGVISLVAGSLSGSSADGVAATGARFMVPASGGATAANGDIYYAETGCDGIGGNCLRIRKIDHANGTVSTVAGTITANDSVVDDYSAAKGNVISAFPYIGGVALLSTGHLLFRDTLQPGNAPVLRIVW
ncbi:MAG: Ig-like domain-containing protein [Myxococcales bacterium]|nr:Ig-like domain-containing protein [Myxococcales bacterium]